jgi:single-strand DNA-binding protein
MPNGDAVANLTHRHHRHGKTRIAAATMREATEWHSRGLLPARLAEICRPVSAQRLSQVYVEGSTEDTRKWQDKDGHDRYTTEIRRRPKCRCWAVAAASGLAAA